MRWLRLILALLHAWFRPRMQATDATSLSFRVWITDIDASVMNHAALLTVMEAGRIDFMVRTGFFKLALKRKWYFPSQAIHVQFHRPLKAFQRAQLFTRLSFADTKWIYIEQKVVRNGQHIASCLIKNTVRYKREVISAQVLAESLHLESFPEDKFDLIEDAEILDTRLQQRIADQWTDF
jgi:acyl-CoA thioesterase FadM